jgi:hypothetical protein
MEACVPIVEIIHPTACPHRRTAGYLYESRRGTGSADAGDRVKEIRKKWTGWPTRECVVCGKDLPLCSFHFVVVATATVGY